MVVGYFLVELKIIEQIRNIEVIAWTTLIFGALLYYSDQFKLDKTIKKNLTYKSILFIGFLQVFSLIPGVSRSGIAITAARFLNFKRVDSAKISFLLSIPILAAVSIFGVKNIIISSSYTSLNKSNRYYFSIFIFASYD